jgi:hypothetical protein
MSQNTYFANESVRITADLTVLGLPATPNTLTLYVTDAAGNTTTYPSPTYTGSPGNYYQDFDIPASPAVGRWNYYWESTGLNPNQGGVSTPQYFYVRLVTAP